MARRNYLQGCQEEPFMVGAQNARPKASSKWFLGILVERSLGATSAITTLGWTSSSALQNYGFLVVTGWDMAAIRGN
jgi:hypothetical protein